MLVQTERLFEVGKLCTACGEIKDTSEFAKHSGRADGLQPFCRPCNSAAAMKWIGENYDHYIKKKNETINSLDRIWKRVYDNPSNHEPSPFEVWREDVGLEPLVYTVYRFYNSDNELIYIGRTENFQSRMYGHFTTSPFRAEIDRVEWDVVPDKLTMVFVELALIARFQPKHNKCRRS